ncbi:VCBS repeat-containing protein [Candidatus Desantisbacteria bacterium]|nr:VCBS repeat-containing protein [Candidatus Desantisbacteria bacterium]
MKRFVCILFLIVLQHIQAEASSPTFAVPDKLKSNVLDCGESVALSIGDLDGDGKQDMVVGDENGTVWFYKNSGANNSPIFTIGVKITTPTGDIQVNNRATLCRVNWNADTLPDLLVGDEAGLVYLFIGINNSPQFNAGIMLKDNNGNINVGKSSAPILTDYNSDGIPDLLVGNDEGFLWYYPGIQRESHTFGTGTKIQAMKAGTRTDINVGGKAAPVFYDWNEDGLEDMIVGDEYGYINYFRNTGTKTSPAFGTVSLRIKANNNDIDVGWEAKQVIIDWDGDKKNDLLIADKTGQITLFRNTGLQNSPVFSSGSKIQGEETVLDVGGFSAPTVVDWDGDGRKDLLIGNELGNISVCLNLGTDKFPIFGAGFKVQTSAGTVTTTATDLDVGYNSTPCIIDWDENGKKDLLVGDKYGKIGVYLNSGTDIEPVFGSRTILQRTVVKEVYDTKTKMMVGTQTYEDLDVGDNASVFATDWNNDKAIDLVVGNLIGEVGVFLNSGSNKQPVFGTYTPLTSAGININVRRNAVPTVCHWNNDGRKDLIVGSGDGVIYLYLNQGTDAAPVFSMPYTIYDNNGKVIDVGENSTPVLVDWNDDEYKDLLIGNSSGEIFYSQGNITNSTPSIEILTPTGTQNNSVSIEYILRDADSDSINIKIEYSRDGGFNWKPATPANMSGDGQVSLFSTPNGVNHVFVWDALADLGRDKPSYLVKFRITPQDTEAEGATAITGTFTVDNIAQPNKRLLTVGGATLDVGNNAKPYVVDWNNDGRKDLLVGNSLGQVCYLQNVGTDKEPIFTTATNLNCGASLLDVGYNSAPVAVFDWNNDMKKDLLVGDSYGFINYFKNIGTDDSPSFEQVERVGNGTRSTVNVNSNSTPFVCNWDNKGGKDLVVGNYQGGIEVFINIGIDANPAFGSATKVLIGTRTELNLNDDSTVFVVDWNDNNKKDLICGSKDGKVYRVLNYGTDNAPLFHQPTAVTMDGEAIDVGANSAPVVCDWNNDGIKDLLVGNEDGQVMLYLLSTPMVNTPPRINLKQIEGVQFGSVTIAYTLSDDQGDTCNIKAEYSTDNGQVWRDAGGTNTDSIIASPNGESHGFIWLSENNLPGTNTQVSLRITPTDETDMGSSSQISFLLDNLNTYPEVTGIMIVGTASGKIEIIFKAIDADADRVNIDVEYSTGNVWKKASVVGATTGLLSEVVYQIVWLSTVDESNKSGDYQIRITPSDYKGQGTSTVSAAFSLNQSNLSSRIIKKGETPTLIFSPTRLAIQKPFDRDMLATIDMMNNGLPLMDTYPELNNTVRRVTITGIASNEPVSTLPATLTIPYTDIASYETEKNLQIYELQQDKWVKSGGVADINNNEVSCAITQDGVYRIGLSIGEGRSLKELADTGVLWVAPNPFKPNDGKQETGVDRIVFGNLKPGTRVKIYTISGELVRESNVISDGGCKWDWDVKNEYGESVGSGVYIYAVSCGDDALVIDKLAVVR